MLLLLQIMKRMLKENQIQTRERCCARCAGVVKCVLVYLFVCLLAYARER